MKNLLFVFALISTSHAASFRASKKVLKALYASGGESFYCQETFTTSFTFGKFDSYKPVQKHIQRLKRVEWEHVVPASRFGKYFKEWKGDKKCGSKSGRKCARKNRVFSDMEGDLINLVPSIGQVNALRENFHFDEIPGHGGEYGNCDIKVGNRRFEPPAYVKGDVARIYRYMQAKYGYQVIEGHMEELFKTWESLDPISDEECKTAFMRYQGNDAGLYNEWCAIFQRI
jgi:deoxyribonuclease-1